MKKILVIDDDEDILNVLDLLLSSYGFSVKREHDWRQVYKYIEGFKPDLIMLDFYLSGGNGGSLYKQIKKKKIETPILMFSARDDAWKVIKYKCDGFIQKPFESKELIGKINELLKCE